MSAHKDRLIQAAELLGMTPDELLDRLDPKVGESDPVSARDDTWREWWYAYPGDARKLDTPPGACPDKIHHDGDPSTPCILGEGHNGDHEDVEGYFEPNWDVR